jgi:hypothetical protein
LTTEEIVKMTAAVHPIVKKLLGTLKSPEPESKGVAKGMVLPRAFTPKDLGVRETAHQINGDFAGDEVGGQRACDGLQLDRMNLAVAVDERNIRSDPAKLRILLQNWENSGEKTRRILIVSIEKADIAPSGMA